MMTEAPNGQCVVLSRYPKGSLQPSDFAVETCPSPSVNDGEFIVRTMFISVDPMLRLFVDRTPFGDAMPSMPLGTIIPGAALGKVVETRHPEFDKRRMAAVEHQSSALARAIP
jgi:NADPH-dependent curcumin reductase CurA